MAPVDSFVIWFFVILILLLLGINVGMLIFESYRKKEKEMEDGD